MSSEEAYFAFETRPETATFVFKLTDPQKIAERHHFVMQVLATSMTT
jgi:hypothetical protein